MEYFGDIQSKRNVIICAANYNKLTSHFSRLSKTPKRLEASEGLERERGEFGGERERKIAICTTTKVTPESYLSNTLSRKSVQTGAFSMDLIVAGGGGVDGVAASCMCALQSIIVQIQKIVFNLSSCK